MLFSLSKLKFVAAFQKLRGANVLLLFGFYYTGMPIMASAGKISRKVQKFKNPYVFYVAEEETPKEVLSKPEEVEGAPAMFKGKKSKSVSYSNNGCTPDPTEVYGKCGLTHGRTALSSSGIFSFFENNQNNSNQDSSSTEVPHTGLDITLVLRSMKMEVPKFDGSDPNGWAFRIEEFFDFHGTEDSLRLRIVSFHLKGRASAWY
ncbi:hypothetical protein AgCh_012646 [Apium graveolens]